MAKAIGYKKADQFAGTHSVVIQGETHTFTVAWHEPDGDSECYWCNSNDSEGTYGQWFTSRGAFQDYIDRHTV
jgi:hypothetical protein